MRQGDFRSNSLRALQAIKRDFSHETRHRGEEYYRRGAVEIIDTQPNRVRARVRGTNIYDLSVEWDGSQYSYSCTCPRFQQHEDLCKHIWATLLAADAKGILPGAEEDVDDDEDPDEEFTPEVREMQFGNRKVEFVKYRERAQPSQPRRHAVWRRRLDELRSDWRWNGAPPPAAWPAGKEIVYA